jgi:hypothetical protein
MRRVNSNGGSRRIRPKYDGTMGQEEDIDGELGRWREGGVGCRSRIITHDGNAYAAMGHTNPSTDIQGFSAT